MTSAAKGPALPFRGEFGEPLNVEALAVENAAGNGAPLLSAVLRDPHLLELDRDIRFADVLQSARQGTLDSDEFLMRGRLAIAAYRRRCGRALTRTFTPDSDVAVLLEQKLVSLANPLLRVPARRSSRPLQASRDMLRLFNRGACVVPLTPVRGAKLLYSNEGRSAFGRYAWRMSTPADLPSRSQGAARLEFGRAVFVDDVDLSVRTGRTSPAHRGGRPNCIRTQIVIKGVGPTRFANNRFSRRASGVLTLLQGERDWKHSETLAAGGVPVYRPVELTLLPYWEWHPRMGWWPMVIYARLPLENLRISDLELLPAAARRQAMDGLRSKLAAFTGVPVRGITVSDVVRFVVARMGRIAGLCEAGTTFGGRPFFHGFLHPQNFSLLGELVDLGEGRFTENSRALAAAYARSGYVNPERNWSSKVRHAGREAEAFLDAAQICGRLVTSTAGASAQDRRDISVLFWRAYRDGHEGLPANDVSALLEASATVRCHARGAA